MAACDMQLIHGQELMNIRHSFLVVPGKFSLLLLLKIAYFPSTYDSKIKNIKAGEKVSGEKQ